MNTYFVFIQTIQEILSGHQLTEDNGMETSMTTTHNKEYTLSSISLEKSQMDGSGTK